VGSTRRPGSIAAAALGSLALAGGLALAASAAAAGGPGDPFDLRAACSDDFRRFCADLGGEAPRREILRCLASHEPDLSPGCRIAVGEETGGDDDDRGRRGAPRRPRPAPTIP
jgi:hypothetical protein